MLWTSDFFWTRLMCISLFVLPLVPVSIAVLGQPSWYTLSVVDQISDQIQVQTLSWMPIGARVSEQLLDQYPRPIIPPKTLLMTLKVLMRVEVMMVMVVILSLHLVVWVLSINPPSPSKSHVSNWQAHKVDPGPNMAAAWQFLGMNMESWYCFLLSPSSGFGLDLNRSIGDFWGV